MPRPTVARLREEARSCRACSLWRDATQTVFGEGPARAELMLVGEQPGDAEDRAGRPFVGPAGRLLDDALADAGLDRASVYLTNAVKHFKWVRKGKRRIHKQPAKDEVLACSGWLEGEIQAVRPRAILCLGATASNALLGPTFRVSRQRGRLVPSELAELVMATVHPASILRAGDDDARRIAYEAFVADLSAIARALRRDATG